jgi:hypothetical protein
MTPRQRRQHLAGMGIVATAPRKSYLGKFTPLTSVQSAWVKSLLTVWGECVREILALKTLAGTPAGMG